MATVQDAQQFEEFLNRLSGYGVRASLVDENGELLTPESWVKDLWSAVVLNARESDEQEGVFYAVELSPTPEPEPGDGALVVYITDPATQPRPGTYVFRLHTSTGTPEERFLMLAPAPLQGEP